MSNKYFGGVVNKTGVAEDVDADLKAVVTGNAGQGSCKRWISCVWQMQFQKYLPYSRRCNKYIDETMPWALAKDEAKQDRLADGSLQSGREYQYRRRAVKELSA